MAVNDATNGPDLDWRDYIVCDAGILGGKPTLKGTRLSVEFVLELLAGGWERESIRQNYPNLTEERIRAVLAYAAETFREDRFHLLPPARTGS
jgi:uncharacterized protein (DUF433 family)